MIWYESLISRWIRFTREIFASSGPVMVLRFSTDRNDLLKVRITHTDTTSHLKGTPNGLMIEDTVEAGAGRSSSRSWYLAEEARFSS